MKKSLDREQLLAVYSILLEHFGHRSWWPAKTRIEICIGAILTQNTSWKNVTQAIANLEKAGLLNAKAILALEDADLADLIRPSGYYNLKAKRLKSLMRFLDENGGPTLRRFEKWGTDNLRKRLLETYGVGAETADSILLYALNRPVFVIDAYTKRITARLGWSHKDASYDELQELFSRRLEPSVDLYNDFHAQFVALGADVCKPKPRCDFCPLKGICPKLL
jgi:endonuclease-3 related protein